jgi:hypothetical protein
MRRRKTPVFYRTVEINGEVVLLFKSNTHLDWPGATFLTA